MLSGSTNAAEAADNPDGRDDTRRDQTTISLGVMDGLAVLGGSLNQADVAHDSDGRADDDARGSEDSTANEGTTDGCNHESALCSGTNAVLADAADGGDRRCDGMCAIKQA